MCVFINVLRCWRWKKEASLTKYSIIFPLRIIKFSKHRWNCFMRCNKWFTISSIIVEIEVPYWHQAAPSRPQSGPVLNLLVSEQKNKCAPTTVLLLDKHIYIIYFLKWKMSPLLYYRFLKLTIKLCGVKISKL